MSSLIRWREYTWPNITNKNGHWLTSTDNNIQKAIAYTIHYM